MGKALARSRLAARLTSARRLGGDPQTRSNDRCMRLLARLPTPFRRCQRALILGQTLLGCTLALTASDRITASDPSLKFTDATASVGVDFVHAASPTSQKY